MQTQSTSKTSKASKGFPGLVLRGNQYYFRQRVQSDLVAAIGCREFRRSLKTSDYPVALALAKKLTYEASDRFIECRRSLPPRLAVVPPVVMRSEITSEEEAFIVASIEHHYLSQHDQMRMSRPTDFIQAIYFDWLQELDRVVGEYCLTMRMGAELKVLVRQKLAALNIALDMDSDEFKRLGDNVAIEIRNVLAKILERGDRKSLTFPKTPQAPIKPLRKGDGADEALKSSQGLTVLEVMAKWAIDKKPRDSTMAENKAFIAEEAVKKGGKKVSSRARKFAKC